jgi:hypothetical protein
VQTWIIKLRDCLYYPFFLLIQNFKARCLLKISSNNLCLNKGALKQGKTAPELFLETSGLGFRRMPCFQNRLNALPPRLTELAWQHAETLRQARRNPLASPDSHTPGCFRAHAHPMS